VAQSQQLSHALKDSLLAQSGNINRVSDRADLAPEGRFWNCALQRHAHRAMA
jgi:hypothetical protein